MIAINHTVSDDSQERKNKNKQKNIVTQVCTKDKGKTPKLTHEAEAGKASCRD